MTERTPEQAALMDLIFEYAQATAAPTGDTDDEYQVWENRVEGLYRQIEAIVCAPKVEPQWQPIATAPTLQDVLVFNAATEEAIVAASDGKNWHTGWETLLRDAGKQMPFNPTHWMPAPKTPKQQSKS